MQDFEFIFLNETESTNFIAKENLAMGKQTVVIADCQTAGRGRNGRSFSSGRGGLYMSAGFLLDYPLCDILHFPVLSAVAVCRTLEEYGIATGFKWPNDIILDGKKVCGILAEGVSYRKGCGLVIGIGINISNDVPSDITNAGTIKELTGKAPDRNELARRVLDNLKAVFDKNPMEEARERCITIGKKICAVSLGKEGTAVGICPNGSLNAVDENGKTFNISFGDVTVHSH